MIQSFLYFLKKNNWLPVIWTLLMCGLFFAPSSDLPKDPGFPGLDKVVHFGLFAGFVFLWQYRVPSQKLLIGLFAILFGAGVEFIQEWMGNGRSFDGYDILADTLGATGGWLAVYLSERYFLKESC